MADWKPGGKLKEPTIKAFELGAKKLLSKREQEELKKKKDEADAAAVYEEFVASFEDSQKSGMAKTWVKGGVVNPGDRSSNKDLSGKDEKSRLYRPTSKLAELAASFKSAREAKEEKKERERESRFEPRQTATGSSQSSKNKKVKDEKKKSNLELFKEELKLIQEERQERHKLKRALRDSSGVPEVEPPPPVEPRPARMGLDFLDMSIPFTKGSVPSDPADESTTNIYVGNINPKMTETQLCESFGKYGPLASVKIMWPRTEEERARGRNCGFVAFMNRKDGERAMNALRGKEIQGFEMKLGWGKAVPIPAHPIYIPPALAELTQPPPPSGLPFNAQPQKKRKDKETYGSVPPPGQDRNADKDRNGEEEPETLEKTLSKAVVKVTIPTERAQLYLIHRMIEFVVREGPMFEAMIMNRELNNPQFRFLFENQSPSHLYYRWKLFSILQGDTPFKWRTDEFRMFKGGSTWRPPPINPYTQGMPEDLVGKEVEVEPEPPPVFAGKKGSLTDSQRDRLEDMLRSMTAERCKVGDLMIWCLDHAEAAEEIVECITESLSILQTPLPKKIARLYLVSDILHNSSAKVPNASFFRKCFQTKLKDIFKDIHEAYKSIEQRLKAEQFKQRVMAIFRAWEDWAIYPNDFLINLQNIFLGLVFSKKEEESPERESVPSPEVRFIDGLPLEDLDGAPLSLDPEVKQSGSEDIDGEELPEDLDGLPLPADKEMKKPAPVAAPLPTFTRSKWETVDEAELEAQAMTTSKWDMLEQESDGEKEGGKDADEDIDGAPMEEASEGPSNDVSASDSDEGSISRQREKQEMTEERRAKLREIELKVIKYQDDVESGRRSRKSHMSVSEQVAHYRRKLLSKEERNSDDVDSPARDSRRRQKSRSPATPRSSRSDRRSGSRESPKRCKKNKSPKRSKRSRSRSPHVRSPHRERKRHRKHRD